MQVMASAPSDINLLLWRELGASTTHSNADVIKACDVVFLAVKPQMLNKVVQDLWVCPAAEELRKMESKLFVSVLAGVTTETLAKLLAQVVAQPRVIRANPNTPAMVGCGASAFSLGSGTIIRHVGSIEARTRLDQGRSKLQGLRPRTGRSCANS